MKSKLNQGRLYCLVSAIIIFGSYIIQRILTHNVEQTRHFLIGEALVFTALTVLVYILIVKSKEAYYGILIAMFGIRMLPPEIGNLAQVSKLCSLLYFLVDRVSILIFVIIIIILYRRQPKPEQIKVLPIIGIISIVPFFNEVQSRVFDYLVTISNGNLIMAYFSGYAVYSVAMIALLYLAIKSNPIGTKMICDFQLLALALNIGRRSCAVAINLFEGTHISASYYGWILVYIFFFLIFYFIKRSINTEENQAI